MSPKVPSFFQLNLLKTGWLSAARLVVSVFTTCFRFRTKCPRFMHESHSETEERGFRICSLTRTGRADGVVVKSTKVQCLDLEKRVFTC